MFFVLACTLWIERRYRYIHYWQFILNQRKIKALGKHRQIASVKRGGLPVSLLTYLAAYTRSFVLAASMRLSLDEKMWTIGNGMDARKLCSGKAAKPLPPSRSRASAASTCHEAMRASDWVSEMESGAPGIKVMAGNGRTKAVRDDDDDAAQRPLGTDASRVCSMSSSFHCPSVYLPTRRRRWNRALKMREWKRTVSDGWNDVRNW